MAASQLRSSAAQTALTHLVTGTQYDGACSVFCIEHVMAWRCSHVARSGGRVFEQPRAGTTSVGDA